MSLPRAGRARRGFLRAAAGSVLTALALAGALSPSAGAARRASSVPHVMVLMMENRSASDVLGHAPYETRLAHTYQLVASSYGVGHYSLDNYLAALSGRFDTWATGDCSPGSGCRSSAPNLASQLQSAHISWDAYFGSMPRNCDPTNADTGRVGQSYGVRHDPFVYFSNLVPRDCAHIEPSARMAHQLNSASAPSFVWYSPQICHDGGGDDPCATLANGDRFLAHQIPAIQRTAWYRHGGVIVLSYDEGNGAGQGQGEYTHGSGNHVLTVVISTATRRDRPYRRYVNEFGLLAGLEHAYHLPCLAQACRRANGRLPLPAS